VGHTIEVIEIEDLVALESRVWRALRDGDGDADRTLLAEDFLGVYPTGFSDRAGHVGQLAKGPTVATFEICNPQMLIVGDYHVMLAYRAEFCRPGEASQPETMFVSSLWARRNGRWENRFSQDSPV